MSKVLGSFDEKMLSIFPSCIKGKQHNIKFLKEGASRVQDLLELVHSDVCGPLRTPTFSRCTYFVTFIDDRSKYTKIYLLKSKAEVFSKFQQYKVEVENQIGKKITMLKSDNGGEYKSNEFNIFCENHSI